MKRKQLDNLEKQYAKRIENTVSKQITGSNINEDLEWINSTSNLLKSYKEIEAKRRASKEWIWPSIIALVCLMIAGFLWFKPVGDYNVLMSIECEAVNLKLASPWSLDKPFSTDLIRIEQLSKIIASPIEIEINSPLRDAWLKACNGNIFLDKIIVTPLDSSKNQISGELTFSKYKDKVEIISKGNHLEGMFLIDRESQLEYGESVTQVHSSNLSIIDKNHFEAVEFVSQGLGAVGTKLELNPMAEIEVRGLKIHGIDFLKEDLSKTETTLFISTIKGGIISVLDVPSEDIKLREGDNLILKDKIIAQRLEISISDNIRILFKGTVENLKVGPDGFERNIAPSLLELWYNNEPLAWFWSVVLLLFGLLGSIRKLFFVIK